MQRKEREKQNFVLRGGLGYNYGMSVDVKNENTLKTAAFALIMLLAVFLRLYHLGEVPRGLHQDEANIGYEAYILANYGVDRDLNPFPVYPITYGSGGGSPLMIYLNVLTTKLFGPSIIVLRALPAVLGCVTVALFGLLCGTLKGGSRRKLSVAGCFVLAICPWHIMLSRWSLDANTVPLWETLLLLAVIRGAYSNKTGDWCVASALAALNLYAYGSANIVIPVFLVTGIAYCLLTRVLKPVQLIPAAVTFLVVAFPLILFYAVNYLGLDEIHTPYFTVNRFTNNRLAEVFIFNEENVGWHFRQNLITLLKEFTIGFEDDIYTCHVPGFATMYRFSFPLTLTGIAVSLKKIFTKGDDGKRVFCPEAMLFAMLIGGSVLHLMIKPEIQRLVYFYIPLAAFQAAGLSFLFEKKKQAGMVAAVALLVGCAFFTRAYHGRYNASDEEWLAFMPGYVEASVNARAIAALGEDVTIYHTRENVTSLFQIALYANRTDPYVFNDTVVYGTRNPYYRAAEAFENMVFHLPGDVHISELDPGDHPGDIFVVNEYEAGVFNDETWGKERFGKYTVVYPPALVR